MRAVGVLGPAGLLACVLSCGVGGAFACEDAADCPGGRCEPTGFCSFPDDECESGWKYGNFAGDGLAGECVAIGEASDGSTSTAGTTLTTTGTLATGGTDSGESTVGPTGLDDDSSTTATGPACGNGDVDPGEDCDDNNREDGDGCNNDCTVSGTPRWAVTWNGAEDGSDEGRDIALLDGDLVIAGWTRVMSIDNALLLRLGGGDGGIVWETQFAGGAGGDDRAYGIASADSGSLYFVGREFEAGNNQLLGKLEPGGDVAWTRNLGPGTLYDVVVRSSDIVVAGDQGLPVDLAQARVVDLDGTVVETVDAPTDGPHRTFALAEDVVGVILAGQIGAQDFGPNAMSLGSLHRMQGGAYSPYAEFGGDLDLASFQAVAVLAGDVVAAGYSWTAAGDRDTILVRYSDGSVIWSDVYSFGPNSEEIEGIAVDAVGDIVCVGFQDHGVADEGFWVRKYTADGEERWTWTENPTGDSDFLRAVAIGDDNDIYIVGTQIDDGTGTNVWAARFTP